MAKKKVGAIEISPGAWEKKKEELKLEEASIEEDDGKPLRPMLCVKNRFDYKRFDKTEDCFILDFDPDESLDLQRLSISDNLRDGEGCDGDDDDDLAIIYEKGQVACRDYAHPRHLCFKFPFETTSHETHCRLCYCYVCDVAAPCAQWTVTGSRHCDATEHIPQWTALRCSMKRK